MRGAETSSTWLLYLQECLSGCHLASLQDKLVKPCPDSIVDLNSGERLCTGDLGYSCLHPNCIPSNYTPEIVERNLLGLKIGESGTRGRTRTGTPLRAGDFESPMSTNFITLALSASLLFLCWDAKSLAYFESLMSTNFITLALKVENGVRCGE